MAAHPSAQSLEQFLSGELSRLENRDIVRHLVAGCSSCSEETTRLWEVAITGRRAPVAPPEAYELAFERARKKAESTYQHLLSEREAAEARCRELLRLSPNQQNLLVRNDARFQTLPLCDALLAETERVLYDNTEAAVGLAELASGVAEELDGSTYGSANVADARARAWSVLARAQRESSDYIAAEAALRTARSYLDEGTGDPSEKAEYLSALGCVLIARRRIPEALKAYTELEAIYTRSRDRHMLGRVQLKKAVAYARLREPKKEIELLRRALTLLDPARDPRRTTIARHNLVLALIDQGEAEAAASHVDELRHLHQREGSRLNLVRFRWLEGRLAHALGDTDTALECYTSVRNAFIEFEIGIDVALVSLDLAAALFDRGDLSDAQRSLAKAIPILKALGVHAEARAAMAMLEAAVRVEAASVDLIRRTAAFIHRVQSDPSVRFETSELAASLSP